MTNMEVCGACKGHVFWGLTVEIRDPGTAQMGEMGAAGWLGDGRGGLGNGA
jgi:hypothetical protein